jgi:isoquinoline 1-oxidoreductase
LLAGFAVFTLTSATADAQWLKLKTPGQYTLVGQSVPQLDIPPKTNGTAKYGIDAMVPGMLYGKPVVPPVRYGAKVAAVDDSTAKQVKGFVKAVTLDDKTGTTSGWVVAVATTYDAAKKAADALKIAYDKGPYANVSDQTLIDEAKRLQKADGSGQLFVKKGDHATAIKGANATYTLNFDRTFTPLRMNQPTDTSPSLASCFADASDSQPCEKHHLFLKTMRSTRAKVVPVQNPLKLLSD